MVSIHPRMWYLLVSPAEANVGLGRWSVGEFESLEAAAEYRDRHDFTKAHAIVTGQQLIDGAIATVEAVSNDE